MPFKAQEIWDRGGVYYGQNAISKNLIVADRRQLLNGNAFILGVSGSGKSFSAKKEMVSLALSTQDDIIVIDPESEYRPLIEGLGGQVINISATSPNHINAMDMEQGYGDGENPVVLKSEFLLSLCEQLIGQASCPPRKIRHRPLHRAGVPGLYPQRLSRRGPHLAGLPRRAAPPAGKGSTGCGAGHRTVYRRSLNTLPSPPMWTPMPVSSAMISGILASSFCR